MERKEIEREATLIQKNLTTQIESLSTINATMPVVMMSRNYDCNSFMHHKFLTALHDLQLSVMILQELTNDVCNDLIEKTNESKED